MNKTVNNCDMSRTNFPSHVTLLLCKLFYYRFVANLLLWYANSSRLHRETTEKIPPQMYKVKIIASAIPVERKFRYHTMLM